MTHVTIGNVIALAVLNVLKFNHRPLTDVAGKAYAYLGGHA